MAKRATCILVGSDPSVAKGTIVFEQQVSAAISVAASVPPGGSVVHVGVVAIPTYVTAGRRTHEGNGGGKRSHTGEARFPHPPVR